MFQKVIVKIYFQNSIESVGVEYLRIIFFCKTEYKFSASGLFLKTIFNPSFYRKAFFHTTKMFAHCKFGRLQQVLFKFKIQVKNVKTKLLAEFKLKTKTIQNPKKSNWTKLTNKAVYCAGPSALSKAFDWPCNEK